MAPRTDVRCSIAGALSEIGERWSLLIVREALMGATRFDEFHGNLGVARNILNDRLGALVQHGVMTRTVSLENARIHHYLLTEKGLSLWPAIVALMHWGDTWLHASAGPPIVLVDGKTQKPIKIASVIGQDGRHLKAHEISITAGPGATPIMRKRLQGKH